MSKKKKPAGNDRADQPIAVLDGRGHEVLDTTPMTLPLRFKRGENIVDDVRRIVQMEMSRYAESQGRESFEEADDFDVGDEPEMRSPYELDEGQEYANFGDERRFIEEERAARKRAEEVAANARRSREERAQHREGNSPDQREAGGNDDG